MDYKVYKIYELEDLNRLMKGVKVAKCMGTNAADNITKDEEETKTLNKLEDLSISGKLFCSFCNTNFEDQAQQRLHYKLDWHRYNLRQNLGGLKSISEEKFTQLADDVSSISGSDSDSDTEAEDESDSMPASAAKLASSQKNNSTEEKTEDGDKSIEDSIKRHEKLRLLVSRHAKVFFENADGQILSLYRCLLHGKKDIPENDEQLVPLALKIADNLVWAIIMLGGGHFAAGIFQGKEVLVHKTFHCYTVRARQGGTQSSRDGRSGGSHPKSAGASLRRYNEAALIQHVQDIMDSWSSQLSACSLILCRAVGHNRNVLFNGKNPPLNKADPRLRTIPFATRRATFSEVKRIHDLLTSLEIYGPADAFQTTFPQSPRKRSRSQVGREGTSRSSTDVTAPRQNENTSESNSKNESETAFDDSKKDSQNSPENNLARSPRRSSKQAIDRAKPRKSPHRPFPRIVNDILSRSSSESDMSESQPGFTSHNMVDEDLEISFEELQEFEDTVPQGVKDRKRGRNKKTGKNPVNKQVEKDLFNAPIMSLRTKLWAACRLGDTELLVNTLQTAQPIAEEPENCEGKETNKHTEENVITSSEYLKCLNESVGESKESLLHVAAQGGHMDIVRALMEAGCDPCVKNKKSQTPYVVSANKETRNTFRRFVADFPDKYDYTKSQIAGPLTDDMAQKMAEKRKEQKKAKREREKERKEEDKAKREEEAEKERFLRLSDREKRALAAERRLLSQSNQGTPISVVSRCFLCGTDITGKVPFEYDIHRFCSMVCLKAHRLSSKNVLPKQ